MLFRRSNASLAAFVAANILLQPVAAFAATARQGTETVVLPDAHYLASEMQLARGAFAALAPLKTTRAIFTESQIARPAKRSYTPFAVIDPATGKTVPRSASIVLTLGKHKGQTVNAGTYWDQVNTIESAATNAGASLLDKKPIVTGALRFDAGSLKGGPGASAKANVLSIAEITSNVGELKALSSKPSIAGDYPKGITPGGGSPYAPAGTPALLAQHTAIAMTALQPQPCLNAPTLTIKTTALKADMDSLGALGGGGGSMIAPSPTPSPSPTPASGRFGATMHGTLPQQAVLLHPAASPAPPAQFQAKLVLPPSELLVHELALEQQKCPNPISPLPAAYDEADLASFFSGDQSAKFGTGNIGDPGVAAVQFDADVAVGPGQKTARKPAPTLTSSVDAKAYLFGSEADFLSATASAGGESAGNVDLIILGQSAETKSLATGSAAGGTSNTYTILNVNASIPIIAGIDVDLAANVSGTLGLKYALDLGTSPAVTDLLSLEETGKLDATFNASMDVDAIVVDVSGGVRGSLQFASFDIPANGAIDLVMVDRTIGGKNDRDSRHIRDCQLNLSYVSGVGGATIAALTGNVVAYARECIEYVVGSSCSEQDVTIANFGGASLSPSAGTPWKTLPVGPRYTDGPSYGIPLTPNERFSPDDPTTAIPRACNRFPIQYAT